MDGKYTLTVSPKAVLVFSFTGMKTQRIPVKGRTTINVKFEDDDKTLEDLVVIGHGATKKVSISGAITSIKGQELRMPTSSLTSAFAGQIAGVISMATSGAPGSASEFYIRGVSTFGGRATPLIMLDDVEISANSQYVKGNVSLKSDGIKTLAEGYKDGRYVLPLVLESKTDSVNAERRRVILRPTVLTPTIAFPSQWQPSVVVARTENEKEFRFTLELPFNSPWDFTVKVAWDEKRFDGWNTLGEANYSIPNGGVVQFRKGSNRSEEVVVKLKNSPELLGGRHVLPLKITDISKSGILPQDGRHQYWILPSYNKFPLVASMLSTNAQQPDEGPIANLVDGNTQSYFHTKWAGGNGGVTAPHYFEVRFNEPITTCRFRHTTRHNNNNGAPQIVEIRVSSDGNSWTTLKRIENGMPSAAHQEYVSEVMRSATPFTHLRYVVMKTTTGDAPRFFALGEFEFFTK